MSRTPSRFFIGRDVVFAALCLPFRRATNRPKEAVVWIWETGRGLACTTTVVIAGDTNKTSACVFFALATVTERGLSRFLLLLLLLFVSFRNVSASFGLFIRGGGGEFLLRAIVVNLDNMMKLPRNQNHSRTFDADLGFNFLCIALCRHIAGMWYRPWRRTWMSLFLWARW